MSDDPRAQAKQVADARKRLRMNPTTAARIAGISPLTWKRIEDGKTVRETSLAKARFALGLDDGLDAKPPHESVDLSELDDDDLIAELCRRLKERRRPAARVTLLSQAEGRTVGQRSEARPGKRP